MYVIIVSVSVCSVCVCVLTIILIDYENVYKRMNSNIQYIQIQYKTELNIHAECRI